MSPAPENNTLASSSKDPVGRKPHRRRRRRSPTNSPQRLNVKYETVTILPPITFLPPSTATTQPRPPSNQSHTQHFGLIHHDMSESGGPQPPPLDHPYNPNPSSSAVHGVHFPNLLPNPPSNSHHGDRVGVYLMPGTNPDIWLYATMF